jgi:hypothetical protein
MPSIKSLANIKKNKALETLGDLGEYTGINGLGKTLSDQTTGSIINGAGDLMAMLGIDVPTESNKPAKNSSEVELVNFKTKSEKKPSSEVRIEAAIDYHREIVKAGEHASTKEMHSIGNRVQQIKAELISLSASIKSLQMEFASVSVEQTPEKTGTYHSNFFEWMLNMIRAARERVETSEAWMSAQKNKAGKKGYWGMFKKHGTSFALSNERGVATQVG